MLATHKGDEAIVKLLLEKYHAKVDEKDNQNWNALMLATNKGHEAIVQLLLEHGAKVDEKNNQDWTALMLATHGILVIRAMKPSCSDY